MPRRIHKYDLPAYVNILPPQERRYRKAFFYIERLMEIHPSFNTKIQEIKREFREKKIDETKANQLINQALMETIKGERQNKSM